MLGIIDYGTIVLVWLAQSISKKMPGLIETVLAVDPAVCRHVLHCEVVKDVPVVCK